MNKTTINNSAKPQNSYNLRIFLLLSVFAFFILFLGLRMFNLQVLSHAYYEKLASNQHGSQFELQADRGEIYLTYALDGKNKLVATNISKDMVYAIPREITDKKTTASRLASILEMQSFDIEDRIAGNGSFAVIKKQISEEVSVKLTALKLKGIYLQKENIRFYPEKELASQVIGFLGYEGDKRVGQYGVEGKFEKALAGNSGVLDADTDPLGRWITTASRSFLPASDGDDYYLTIDPNIQFKAEEIIKNRVELHGAEAGSIVVIDPKNGKVLAMANFPKFDLNNYGKVENAAVYNNRILSADYEPGSVLKPITLAAAINEKKVTPQTTYKDEGKVQVDDKELKNSDPTPQGEQNMIQVLTKSLNTGVVFAQQQIGNEKFREYIERFGFGKAVEFELAGQVKGNLDNIKHKGDVFYATASYGQGITVTPLQLAQAFTAIANGGKIAVPYLIEKIVHPDGSEDLHEAIEPKAIINDETAFQLSAMMVEVVENGHGKKAAVPGYYIAGKTGTAQVAYKDKTGYDPNTNIGSFVGYGPQENPRFLAVVRIDNPKDVKFAESTAAPAFGELAAYILNYLQVPPNRQ